MPTGCGGKPSPGRYRTSQASKLRGRSAAAEAVSLSACDVLVLGLVLDRRMLLDVGALAERTKVVLVVRDADAADAVAAVRAGAAGVIGPDDGLEVLVQGITAVAAGGARFHRSSLR